MILPLWLMSLLMVSAAIGLSVGGLRLVRRAVAPRSLREHHDVAGFILAIVGVIYAVLLAFVVLVVWEQFEDAKVVAEQEANATLDIYRMASGFAPPVTARLRRNARIYAESVIKNEWPAMAKGQDSDQTARHIDLFWLDLARFQPRSTRESVLYDQCLSRMTEVSDNRRLRLLACRSGVPGPLWVILIFGAAATIIFTYFFGLEKFFSQALMTALLAATIALALVVISALNYPFTGDLRVPPEAMQSVLERFETIAAHEKGLE